MVSEAEKEEIRKLLHEIKYAKKEDRSQEEINKKTVELINYLAEIGVINLFPYD